MTDPIRVVLIVEIATAVGLIGILVGHGLATQFRGWHDRRRTRVVRTDLMEAVAGSGSIDAAVASVAKLPVRLRLKLLAEFAVNLSGTSLGRVQEIATRLDVQSVLNRLCESRRWKRRLEGIRLVGMLGVGEELAPALLDDPHAEVRAEAAYLALNVPRPEIMDRLVSMLADEAPLCRFAARDALDRAGADAADAIARYLARGGVQTETALEIAAAVPTSQFTGIAHHHLTSPNPAVRAAAARLVAAIGGEDGCAALVGLLDDEAASVRAAAARGLGHLEYWPAAAQLVKLLGDSSWEVRRAAGLGLRYLGAIGRTYLRRVESGHDDPFASDMARLVLSTDAGTGVPRG